MSASNDVSANTAPSLMFMDGYDGKEGVTADTASIISPPKVSGYKALLNNKWVVMWCMFAC